MSTPNVKRDGFDFINVYSKGKTELGRNLSNFSRHPIKHPDYGIFNSIEGLWYWLKIFLLRQDWTQEQKEKIKTLRDLDGYQAKKYGREFLGTMPDSVWDNFPDSDFKEGIRRGIYAKLTQHSDIQKALINSTLPLVHYYSYGKDDTAKVVSGGHQWVIDYISACRDEFQIAASKVIIYRGKTEEDNTYVFLDPVPEQLDILMSLFSDIINRSITDPEEVLRKAKEIISDERRRNDFLSFTMDGEAVRQFISINIYEEKGLCFATIT